MSTRSIVAVPYKDSWRGRYVHSSGYPTGVGAALWKLVKRSGLKETPISRKSNLTRSDFVVVEFSDLQRAWTRLLKRRKAAKVAAAG